MLLTLILIIIIIVIVFQIMKKYQQEKFMDCPCCLPPDFENKYL